MKKAQQIRTKPIRQDPKFEISGWLANKQNTYLWFGYEGVCVGILDGQSLYRLAKAIVRRMEKS